MNEATPKNDDARIDAAIARETKPGAKPVKFNTNPRACYVCNGTVRKNTGHCWEDPTGEGPDRYAHDKCYREDCE